MVIADYAGGETIPNINVDLCGARLKNPTIIASGILGVTGASMCYCAQNGAGAITTKSVSLKPRAGHANPTIITFETGMLNAVGLSNPGIDYESHEVEYAIQHAGVPIIASVFGNSVDEFVELVKRMSELKPKPALIELDISCPNVHDEFGLQFACSATSAAEVTRAAKKVASVPLAIKLAPNVPSIAQIAREVEKAGADALTVINTIPGMVIDIKSRRPVLHNRSGGVSGPALKAVAVKCVYEAYEAVKIPIIGTGGITYGKDVVEMIMAGATTLGIGSAIYYRGVDVFQKVTAELRGFMEQEGYGSLKEMRGVAHEQRQ